MRYTLDFIVDTRTSNRLRNKPRSGEIDVDNIVYDIKGSDSESDEENENHKKLLVSNLF